MCGWHHQWEVYRTGLREKMHVEKWVGAAIARTLNHSKVATEHLISLQLFVSWHWLCFMVKYNHITCCSMKTWVDDLVVLPLFCHLYPLNMCWPQIQLPSLSWELALFVACTFIKAAAVTSAMGVRLQVRLQAVIRGPGERVALPGLSCLGFHHCGKNIMPKRNLKWQGFVSDHSSHPDHSPSLREVMARTQDRNMEAMEDGTYLLAPRDLLSVLSYAALDHLPRDATLGWPGPTHHWRKFTMLTGNLIGGLFSMVGSLPRHV